MKYGPLLNPGRLSVLAALVFFLSAPVPAQNRSASGIYLPTDGEYQILWERIEKSRDEKNWDAVLDGLTRYAELIQEPERNGVIASGRGIALGIRRLLAAAAAALPPTEAHRYRDRLDAVIARAWEDSKERVLPEEHRKLRRKVLRDYRESKLYPMALEEEIDEAFEAGRWRVARRACEQLISGAGTADSPGRLARARALLVQTCAILGDLDGARAEAEALERSAAATEIDADTRALVTRTVRAARALHPTLERPLDAHSQESPLEPLILHFPAPSPRAPGQTSPAPQAGAAGSPFRLGSVIWQRRVPASRLRPYLAERSRVAPRSDVPLPYHAVARDGLIVFQHVDRLSAYDTALEREAWSLNLDPLPDEVGEVHACLLGTHACYIARGRTLRALRKTNGTVLWERTVEYGRASRTLRHRDGAAPAADTPEEEPAPGEAAPAPGPDDERQKEEPAEARPGGEEAPRQEGEDRGKDGRANPAKERPRKNMQKTLPPQYSLSPPAFFRDLIVTCIKVRIDQETLFYLAAHDPAGREAWTTYLGSTQGGNYLGLGGAASVPLAHGDVVYQLTNMGTVAAVDGEDGTLLWIGEYPQLAARGKREAIRVENRWQPNPVLAIGDQLIIAPQDSTYLIALSRMTGEVSWRTPREQGSTLVGADDHACFIAGAELVAIAHSGERRGQTLWRFGAEPPGAPAGREGNGLLPLGRAFFSLDALLVPTRTAFYRLSPADGRVLSRTFWDFAGGGGNLLLTGRLLAVTNPEGFLIYSDLEKERDRIEALPGDATETFLERAKFHLKQGEVPEGLAALKAWERNAPPPPAPNSFLDHLQLDLAEIVSELTRLEETKPHLEALLRYRVRLERAPPRKVAATIALAEHLERAGDRAGALKAFHDGLAFDSPATEYAPDGLPVPSATYIRDRIVRLRRSSPLESGTAFAALDREAREALSQARKKGTPPSYFEVIRLYPYTPAAADALLDLSVFFHDLQSYDRAIRVLEDYLRDYPTGKDALRAKVFMANLLNQSGRRREARERYAILLKEHPDARVEGIPGLVRSETVRAYVEPILRDPLIDAFSPEDPPEFRFPIHMSWRSPADLESASRAFLTPLGETPEELRDCFLTQSLEAIECRRLEDGLPVWKLYFEMVPGYQLEDSQIGRFARPGLRPILGRFVRAPAPAQAANQGHLLLLQDDRNLLAIDPVKGVVRWHVPFGSRDEKPANLRQLRERVRGVGFADDGAYVATTQRELRHVNLEGATLWRAPIDYDPAPHSLAVGGNAIFVIAVKPPGVRIHERGSGRELASLGAPEGFGEKLAVPPVEVSRNRLLLALGGETKGLSGELKLLDLDEQKVLWSVRKGPVIDHLSYSPEFPEECLVVWSRENHLPLIAGISLRDGSELWRYEKFPARKSNFSLFRKQSNIYALHGENDRWQLLALELRRDPDGNRHVVTPLWPKEIPLGTFFTAHHRLHIAEDAILFPDADKMLLAVFDRVTGMSRNASAAAITAFLADKESSFTTAILNGRLVILTDGGDCAFAPEPSGKTAASIAPDMEMVRRFSEKPGDAANTDRLALHYFRAGKRDAAMSVLNRALLAEDILEEKVAENRYLMSYLLDGIKEEHMKDADRRPRISSRQFHAPPAIDGELNDSWDIATRLHLATPRQVGTIPVPGQGRDWEGEEDLSAFLYTGWDHEYFYFALDVMDDVLQAYDKDAENWKGDCLLIGLDPDGAQRNGSEQLMTLALTVPKRNKLEKQKGEKGEEEEEDESRKPDGLFSVKKKDDDSGAIYEVALPWQTFGPQFPAGIGPAEGFAFGLSLLLTDDDTGQGATKTLSLNPCHLLPRSQKNSWVWRFIIHEYFPRVTLER